jgi:hypothetical protein
MSSKTIKQTMTAETYICDICKKTMHLVGEARSAEQDRNDCIHTKKFDAHIKCFEEMITGEVDV